MPHGSAGRGSPSAGGFDPGGRGRSVGGEFDRDRNRDTGRVRSFTSLDARAGQLGVGANRGNVNTRDLTEGFLNAFKTGGFSKTLGFGLANMLAGFAAPNITGPRAGLRGFVPEGGTAAQNFARSRERAGPPSLNEIIALIAARRQRRAPGSEPLRITDPISQALLRLR